MSKTKNPSKQRNLDHPHVFTRDQIAELCQTDLQSVDQWIDRGILKEDTSSDLDFQCVKIEDVVSFIKSHGIITSQGLQYSANNRILVVDDEDSIIESIESALSFKNPGKYVFESQKDGFEALSAVDTFKPDLILLDVVMPGMDGFQFCRELKANPSTKHIKILVVSGFLQKNDGKAVRMNLGADGFLEKPFKVKELQQNVARLLERRMDL